MKKKLSEVTLITGGQIMTRVVAKEMADDETLESVRVVVPKAICSDGTLDASEMPIEKLKSQVSSNKITKVGDIVIKLSTPYDAAIVDENTAGCVVPSFCAIIKNSDCIDKDYLLAFLNSNYCKEQLKQQVAGAVMTVLSVGKIYNVEIPIPSIDEQIEIGKHYAETQNKLRIIKQIIELEAKRNDIVFRDMVKNYE